MFSFLRNTMRDIVYDTAWLLWDVFSSEPHPPNLMIHHARRVLPIIPQNSPHYDIVIKGLGHILFRRFQLEGNAVDRVDALTYLSQAIELEPPGHPERADTLLVLGNAIYSRFECQDDLTDLDNAIAYFNEALVLLPRDDPLRPRSLSKQATVIYARFKRNGNIADLNSAIECQRTLLDLVPERDSTHISSLRFQGKLLSDRFALLGNAVDLHEAIQFMKEVAYHYYPNGEFPDDTFSNIIEGLNALFLPENKLVELNRVIEELREELSLHPSGDPARVDLLRSLGDSLLSRFMDALIPEVTVLDDKSDHSHLPEDPACLLRSLGDTFLSRSVDAQGAEATDLDRVDMLRRLGYAVEHIVKHAQDSRATDLDEASEYYRELVGLLPVAHPDYRNYLSCLGRIAILRYKCLHEAVDINNAIKYYEDALQSNASTNPDHPLNAFDLGSGYLLRFDHSADPVDLDNAVSLLCEANALTPEYHPSHTYSQCLLSKAYTARYDLTRSQHDMDQAFHYFAIVANKRAFFPPIRFQASLFWITEARRPSHSSLLDAYASSLQILDCFVSHFSPDLFAQFKNHSKSGALDLAPDAAAFAIESGDIERAIEFLEQGRGRIWSRMRSYRASKEELRGVDQALADQFESVSRELEQNATSFRRAYFGMNLMQLSLDDADAKYYSLLASWEAALDRIRAEEGFAEFRKAAPFHVLQRCAINGPVIVINHSQYRSDAIIIYATASPQHIPLQKMSLHELENHAASFWNIVQSDDADRAKGVVPVLRYLWDAIVQPIVKELDITKHERIWWCPTSHLCYLPLHAAGPYKRGLRNLPDLVVSSYTPTLSALIAASTPTNQTYHAKDIQGMSPHSLDDDHTASEAFPLCSSKKTLLAVGQPETQGEAKLETVREEFRRLQHITKDCTILMDERGTHNAVLHGLQNHPCVHLTCHGHLDLGDPLTSCFALHDARLSLASIVQEKLPDAELAFLSACHSAGGDPNTPDEILHLAAGMQFAGFRSVVGTMWGMADVDGPIVVETFYRNMFDENGQRLDHTNAAKALNLATKELRKRGVPLDRWINFIHIGA